MSAAAAKAPPEPFTKTGETVTIGCKLPWGVKLDIREAPVTVKGELVAGKVIMAVTLRGSAQQRLMEADGMPIIEHPHVVGGYGLTYNVDKAFWDRWSEENKDYQPFATGMIFAVNSRDSAKDRGRDGRDVPNGLEPMARKGEQIDGVKVEPREEE